jgi:hypothetical protein
VPSNRGTDDLAAMFAAGRGRGSGTKTAPAKAAPATPEPPGPPQRAARTPKAPVKAVKAPAPPAARSGPQGGSRVEQAGERTYPHRVSLDLPSVLYRRLRDLAYRYDLRHITLARHLLALAMESPELVDQAAELARADLAESARNRVRKDVRGI